MGAWPVVVANAVTLALALAILVMKLRYGRTPGGARSGSTTVRPPPG
jgi:MtN3 and saliva related transmembrane protein